MNSKCWPRVAVAGAGAVGGYFGGLLAREGAPVVMIGRRPFVERVSSAGLVLDTLSFKETVAVQASTELHAARGAEVVLFCVKSFDTVRTAGDLAPFLSAGATVVSLQNGVDNVERIMAAGNISAIPAVVYVGASVPEPGYVKHVGRGDLVIGPRGAQTEMLAALFERAGIPCRTTENIQGELWAKLIWNCALNAISALGHASYGRIADSADARRLVDTVVREVVGVAHAAQIELPGVQDPMAAIENAMAIATQLAGAYSSTAQDLSRGKPTEIDSFNGYIAQRGAELGIPTPVNQALFTLVKLAEGR